MALEFVERNADNLILYGARENVQIWSEAIIKKQRADQKEIINTTASFCPYTALTKTIPTVEDINRALAKGFGDATILRTLMCWNNTLFVYPNNPQGVNSSFKVRNYIKNLRQIGGPSAEGYAMTASVLDSNIIDPDDKPYVVKTPRELEEESVDNYVHEYFVGAFGTNALRNRIPNFAFIMGIFKCSPPYLVANEVVNRYGPAAELGGRVAATYCQKDGGDSISQVNYVLYENVKHSVTMRYFVSSGSPFRLYLNLLVQIILTIQLAYDAIDYTHYDLHDGNILIRELDQTIYIKYGNYYLRTKWVATIIDQGRAHIKYEGKDYGYSLPKAGVLPNESFPMYDIYKILMFSMYSAVGDDAIIRNQEVFNRGKALLHSFDPTLATDAEYLNYIRQLKDTFYILPKMKQFTSMTPINFLTDTILPRYPIEVNSFLSTNRPPAGSLVYGCEHLNSCSTLQRAINDYTTPLLDENILKDPFIFFEAFYTYYNAGIGEDSETLNELARIGTGFFPQWLYDLYHQYEYNYQRFINTGAQLADIQEHDGDNTNKLLSYIVVLFDEAKSLNGIYKLMLGLVKIYPDLAVLHNEELNATYEALTQQVFNSLQAVVQYTEHYYEAVIQLSRETRIAMDTNVAGSYRQLAQLVELLKSIEVVTI